MHICICDLTIIGSDNGLSPGWRQAIIWTNAVILSIGPLGTNLSETLIKIITFSFKKMRSKVSSGKWRPSCLGFNVLRKLCRHWCWHLCHSSQYDLSQRKCHHACMMMSEWETNVNKTCPLLTCMWTRTFEWMHVTSMKDWMISTPQWVWGIDDITCIMSSLSVLSCYLDGLVQERPNPSVLAM